MTVINGTMVAGGPAMPVDRRDLPGNPTPPSLSALRSLMEAARLRTVWPVTG